ncbi:MAG TPA: bifunctional phosphoribosylaminoimidazolecarboxamide formyltransferase/IMP cyclohydrolase [Candidatus Acidoferrales bacterium]
MKQVAVRRALISVSDKTGVEEFARQLAALGVEIISTGGTAKLLREKGIAAREVAELTGWPEMLGGRVKTLHPKVHGGILFRRGDAGDQAAVAQHEISPIDLVAVNLYPFEATAAKENLSAEELIENIDIGGPAMLRSAAKNFRDVVVICDPADYSRVAEILKALGDVDLATRSDLARKVFAATSHYDGLIAMELERLSAREGKLELSARTDMPERLHLAHVRAQVMRYGENPHQHAALYVAAGQAAAGLAGAKQLQGKELSYNNLVDLDSAWQLALEFERPAAVIVKHNNPCGAAEQETLEAAYLAALECDPVSAFGGVIAFNRAMDAKTAEEVAKLFVECIVAPGYDAAAREKFASKKNLRLMEVDAAPVESGIARNDLQIKLISGGVLVQTADDHILRPEDLKTVTKREPSAAELKDLLFGWKVCKHVKSNAIVFARDGRTVGVGAGQMSRVDSVRIAVMKAQTPLVGSVVASDAFFPFADGVEEAAKAGATAFIQPGGSVRDADVIAAADRLNLAMVFTGVRHFRH